MKIGKSIALILLWSIPLLMLTFSVLLNMNIFTTVNKNEPLEIISDMDNTVSYKPQNYNRLSKVSGYEDLLPEHSVPNNHSFYRLESIDIEESIQNGENPLPNSKLVLRRGQFLYNTHCTYCHGNSGLGDGPVITKVPLTGDEEAFPGPPSLLDTRAVEYADSRLFHILSAGQNLMFPVAYKLNTTDRLALVHYLRKLQGKSNYAK